MSELSVNVRFIRYNDNSLVLRLNGSNYQFNRDKDFIDNLYEALVTLKRDESQEAYDVVMAIIDPMSAYDLPQYFERTDAGDIVLKGTQTQIPDDLAEFLFSFLDNETDILPFVRFWQLCLMNPNIQARDDFFRYVREYGITITNHGYVVLYKAVNKKGMSGLENFSEFVSENYLKIKRLKKSPSNYDVYIVLNEYAEFRRFALTSHSGNEPVVEEGEILEKWGNLDKTFQQLNTLDKGRQTTYVPWHSGKYGQEIKIGVPVTMPRWQCDPDITVGCSYGLHVGSFDYVKEFGSGLSTILAVLVNPSNIVALPEHDNSKIRTCEYYPYAVIEKDKRTGAWTELDDVYFESDYMAYEVDSLEEILDDNFEDDIDDAYISTENRLVYIKDVTNR